MSSGFDGGRGSVSGPLVNRVTGGAAPAESGEAFAADVFVSEGEAAPAGAGSPPRSALAGNSEPGLGVLAGASVRITGRGGGHPHSRGTLASILSICPAWNTACCVALTW